MSTQSENVKALIPQCHCIRRWDLWEEIKFRMRLRGCSPHHEISALIGRGRDARTSSLHHVRIWGEGSHVQARNSALTKNQKCWHPDLRLPILQNCEK